jgi:glycosyltransferase involved in cell wall biosynthesis
VSSQGQSAPPPAVRPFLLISYFYPPFQSVGALRVSKLSKHLPRHGWRPTVLTVANDTLPPTMPLEIPEAWVHRARMLDVNIVPKLVVGRRRVAEQGFWNLGDARRDRLLASVGRLYRGLVNFPDGQIGWFPAALRLGAALVRAERPALIYSSAMPATCHLIAAALARRFSLPWIAEFRDPWTDNPNYDRPAMLAAVERRLESLTMAGANRVVTVTPDLARNLAAKYGVPATLIPNGFDPEDAPVDVPLTSEFTVTFTGMVYPSKQTLRPVFEALAELRRSRELPVGFVVRLVGRNVEAFAAEAKAAGVSELVVVLPPGARATALRLQAESTVLLLPLWTDENVGSWYPAKMFEYMGARRPILAIGPARNEAARLLSTRGAGWVAGTTAETVSILRRWFHDHRGGGTAAVKPGALLDEFSRERGAECLARLFDDVAWP